MKDPISDSKSKLVMLREHCPGFVIRELDAGKYTAVPSKFVTSVNFPTN